MLPKFIVYSLSFIVLILSTASIALAQTATPSALQPTTYNLPATVSPASPLYTDLLIHNMFHTFSCLAVGQSVIGQPCLTYKFTQNAQGALQGVPVLSQVNTSGGVLGATTNLIGMLYQNPPVRTADYIASIRGAGIVREANAQVGGSGAAVLNPILKLWQVSRNISYVIMILIFMVIGLMIMFRNKINPQTVITAQTALPGLVIGLIMITFSFFFAGLISDMAFVGTNVVGYYFTAAQNKPPEDLAQKLTGSNILNIMGSMADIVSNENVSQFVDATFKSLGSDAKDAVRMLVFWISAQFASNLVPDDLLSGSTKLSPYALLLKPVVGGIIGAGTAFFGISPLLGRLLGFAAALALIYAMLKLFFKLITAWLTIIFLTISAPFQFLFASLPGRQGMMTGWMLNMLGNILIFPAVIAVVYFVVFLLGPSKCPKDSRGDCLIQVSATNQTNTSLISPVYAVDGIEIVGKDTFPLFGGIKLDFVKILLAFGALMALPSIPDIITRAIGKAGQAGQMMGQEIMGNARFGQGYAQRSYTSGIEVGQQVKTGVAGQTSFNAEGKLVVSRPGVIREAGVVGGPPWTPGAPLRKPPKFW